MCNASDACVRSRHSVLLHRCHNTRALQAEGKGLRSRANDDPPPAFELSSLPAHHRHDLPTLSLTLPVCRCPARALHRTRVMALRQSVVESGTTLRPTNRLVDEETNLRAKTFTNL